MSALTTPSPVPPPAQPSLAPQPARPRAVWKWWILLLILGVGALAAYRFTRPAAEPAAQAAAVRTAKVFAGELTPTLRVSGTTSARNFAAIGAPRLQGPDSGRNMVLMTLVKAGTWIRKGDLIAQIDAQAAKDHVDDVDSQVQQAGADIKKRMAEHAIEMERLRQTLRQSKAELDKANLDAGAAEIRTPIDIELLKLSVEESDAHYKQLQADVAFTEARQKADLRILEITQLRHVRHRDRHASDVLRLTIKTPIDGLVVMQSSFRSGEMRQIQEGDTVSPGEPFLKVVDISSMQVDASANQVEAEQLRLGQAVRVRFDAFQELTLPGKVYSLGAMGVGGWRQNFFIRTVPVKIAIDGRDERVIPDLSASGDVQIAAAEKGLLVPLGAIRQDGARTLVRVKTPQGVVERAIETGPRNFTHATVLSGLKAGEEVLL